MGAVGPAHSQHCSARLTDSTRDFGVPFEIASLVLIVALIGAVAVARRDRDEDDPAEEGESS